MVYKLTTDSNIVIRLADHAIIPRGHRWWSDYEGWLAEGNTPQLAQTLTEAKAVRWAAIKAERDRRIDDGGYPVDGQWFHGDRESRLRQLGIALLGAGVTGRLRRIRAALGRGASSAHSAKTMDGRVVTITAALARRMVAAAAAGDQALFSAAERHKAALDASADPANYDFSGGWPTAFGE